MRPRMKARGDLPSRCGPSVALHAAALTLAAGQRMYAPAARRFKRIFSPKVRTFSGRFSAPLRKRACGSRAQALRLGERRFDTLDMVLQAYCFRVQLYEPARRLLVHAALERAQRLKSARVSPTSEERPDVGERQRARRGPTQLGERRVVHARSGALPTRVLKRKVSLGRSPGCR